MTKMLHQLLPRSCRDSGVARSGHRRRDTHENLTHFHGITAECTPILAVTVVFRKKLIAIPRESCGNPARFHCSRSRATHCKVPIYFTFHTHLTDLQHYLYALRSEDRRLLELFPGVVPTAVPLSEHIASTDENHSSTHTHTHTIQCAKNTLTTGSTELVLLLCTCFYDKNTF